MISALGLAISRVFRRYVPDPFVIAVLLTLLTAGLALGFGRFPGVWRHAGVPPIEVRASALLDAWRGMGANEGLWKFLAFSMQMCLILVTGHALAASGPVRRLIEAVARLPRSAGVGASVVGLSACTAGIVNWGLGLIVGAILAREVGRALSRRGVRAHYPLLAAAGYTGLMVWHGGLSGSAPLTMTSTVNAAKVLPSGTIDALTRAGYGGGVGLERTILSPMNGVVTLGLVAIVGVLSLLMSPRRAEDCRTIEEVAPGLSRGDDEAAGGDEGGAAEAGSPTPADRLDRSRVVNVVLALALMGAMWRFGATRSLLRVGIDEVNATMLALGLLLHRSPRSYMRSAEEGARGCVGIILQFPLYAGIMSMLVASGLIETVSRAAVEASGGSGRVLVLLTFASACVVNLFVPSGGGQWGVQGPVALESGLSMGVEPGAVVMAVAYGDQATNMLQPFWALPLLAITGARARDIVGYTAVFMAAGIVWVAGVMLVA